MVEKVIKHDFTFLFKVFLFLEFQKKVVKPEKKSINHFFELFWIQFFFNNERKKINHWIGNHLSAKKINLISVRNLEFSSHRLSFEKKTIEFHVLSANNFKMFLVWKGLEPTTKDLVISCCQDSVTNILQYRSSSITTYDGLVKL